MQFRYLKLQKLIAFVVLSLYLLLPLYIFQHMMSMSHEHMSPMANFDCPYMDGQSAICPLDFFGHLNSLQKNLLIVLPSFKIITLLIFSFLFLNFIYTSPPLIKLVLYIKRQRYKIINDLYQTLFSKGILNTKVF